MSTLLSRYEICKNRILIVDFCSQYTQLIARRVRELGVYCEIIMYFDMNEGFIHQFNPSGLVLSGSPESVNEKNFKDRGRIPDYVFQKNIPILGICYGMHVIVVQSGGKVVEDCSKREFGYSKLEVLTDSLLVNGIYDDINEKGNPVLNVWMSHSDTVVSIPEDFTIIGTTKHCNVAIIANEKKRLYGVQFHPEVTHTIQGSRILERFISKICSCKLLWKPSNIIDYLVSHIRNEVKNDSVILAFSGGIDSLVTALLLRKAIGNDRLICCFVDNGLLRYDDFDYIKKYLHVYGLNIISISSSNLFFKALLGVTDPEEKRKVIGRVFIQVFEEHKRDFFNDVKWLAQGTIYPDIIESGLSNSSSKNFMIKSHHNVGGLPNIRTMKLIEPIRNLFKDEVRNLGYELGVSSDILYRHPFPGPGLGVRILGEVKEEYCNLLRHADSIFIEELQQCNLYSSVSQAFVIFLPVRSVGIMGDIRRYEWVVSLRAIETIDFMTARWVNLPYDFLCKVSTRIINEVDGISRVVYDISTKPPATIEWE